MFDSGSIEVMAYPLETCMAEKLETVLSRGVLNTRPRDYYDIYALWKLKRGEVDMDTLAAAVEATFQQRGSMGALEFCESTMREVASDRAMLGRWEVYRKNYRYAADLTLASACETVQEVMKCLQPIMGLAVWEAL